MTAGALSPQPHESRTCHQRVRGADTCSVEPARIRTMLIVHTPVAAGPDGCELIGMSVAGIRSFQPDGAEIGVGFESLNK